MNIRLIKAKAAEQVLWFVNGQPGLFIRICCPSYPAFILPPESCVDERSLISYGTDSFSVVMIKWQTYKTKGCQRFTAGSLKDLRR